MMNYIRLLLTMRMRWIDFKKISRISYVTAVAKTIISLPLVTLSRLLIVYNKRDGFYGLSSDHILYACDDLYVHIAILFSSLVSHGVVTDDLAFSTCLLYTSPSPRD